MRALGLSGAAPGRSGDLLRRGPRHPPPEPAVGGRRPPACRPGRGPTAPRSSPRPLRPLRRWLGHESALGALEQAIWARKNRGDDLAGLVHHSNHGSKSPAPSPTAQRARRRRDPGRPPEPWDPPTRAPPPKPSSSPRERRTRPGATAPGRDAPTPATATATWVNWHQPHPPPPNQRRQPPTHGRRTPLQSQPHHHRITNPQQNPGLSTPRNRRIQTPTTPPIMKSHFTTTLTTGPNPLHRNTPSSTVQRETPPKRLSELPLSQSPKTHY